MDDEIESESVASFYSDFEGDLEQTISLLEMNVDEVEVEVRQSLEEVWSENLNYYCYYMLSINLTLTSGKLLKEFYGGTSSNWKEYFHPYEEKKVVFLMLIHLPKRLIGFLEQKDKVASEVSKSILIIC